LSFLVLPALQLGTGILLAGMTHEKSAQFIFQNEMLLFCFAQDFSSSRSGCTSGEFRARMQRKTFS
jgi:hypothetical protein